MTYAPNALGQPTQVGSYATGVTYFPNGAVKQFTYGNGIVRTLQQNDRGLPYRIRDAKPATPDVFDDFNYYDQNGNVIGLTDGASGRAQRGNRDMTYDGLDRLSTVLSPMWGTTTPASYTYDALDNLIQVVMPAFVPGPGDLAHPQRDHHYCYDGSNRLTNVKTVSCTTGGTVMGLGYDVQGNLKNKSGIGYHFDYGNRLRRVGTDLDTPSEALIETYRYDGLGRRVQSRLASGLRVLSQYSREGKLVYQYDYRTSERIDYLHLGNSLVATRTRPISTAVYTTEYQHTDALGSPVVTSNAAGTRLDYDEYEPYGKRLNRANDNRPGHTGHVMDEATGLTYMQQRYYDPGVGMFLSVDPVTALSDPVGYFGRYHYAANNPYKFNDPDGRAWGLVAKVVKVIAKGGDVAATFAGAVEDGKILLSSDASLGQRAAAGASLASEVASPVSVRDVKAGIGVAKEVSISRAKYGDAADHIADAQKAGHPDTLTIAKGGAAGNRKAATGGVAKVPGKQLDEYPPAMFAEGGAGASVRPINPRDNMAAGACIGNACRGLADGEKVRIKVID